MHLLKHFKELSLRPKNVQELKGLILQLAIQGKLTANWRKLNNEVELDFKKLKETSKKSLNFLNNESSSIDELEVPSTWLKLKFKTLFEMQGGSQPPKSMFSSTEKEGYIQLYQIRDFGKRPVPVYVPKESVSKLCAEDDIMIGRYGASIGKVFYGKNGAYNVALVRLIWNRDIIVQNFVYQIFSSYYMQEFFQNCTRSAQAGFNKTDMGKLNIPIPPLEEQKEIVKVVEILFKEVEKLEKLTVERISLKKNFVTSAVNKLTVNNAKKEWDYLQKHFHSFFNETTNIKRLRESVLQLATQGKLTADWRANHPKLVERSNHARELLKNIQKEKAQLIKDKKIKKEKSLPSIIKDEIPHELPDGWVWCRFQDLIVNIEAGKSPKCYPENSNDNEWGVIKMSAISWGFFNAKENKALPIDMEVFEDKEIKPGDFILTRANTSELIAKSVIVQADVRSKLLLNDKTLRIQFFDSISEEYLNLYNNGSQAREYYKKASSGTSDSMQNISRENIKLLIIPLPPLEEQQAIVKKVNALMGLCDRLEREVLKSQEQSEKLMQSVLREVFEGKKELKEV